MMDTAKPPSGQAIHEALRVELTSNLYRLPSSTIAPTLFHVYLHQEDFDTIEGIVPRIVLELASALTRDVERLNAESSPNGLLSTLSTLSTLSSLSRKPAGSLIEIPASGWDIFIQPDLDGEVPRGAFGIVSKLTIPTRPEFVGPPTVRTVKTVVADGRRTSAVTSTTPATATADTANTTPTPSAPTAPAPSSSAGAVPQAARKAATPRAMLTYTDDSGPHMFPMQKDVIKIGRGGSGTWVDLQVITGAKVSREHCWIRCDEAGQFFIRDTSTWGTAVNGRAIGAARRSATGDVVEPGVEEALPADASVALADTVVIHVRGGSQS